MLAGASAVLGAMGEPSSLARTVTAPIRRRVGVRTLSAAQWTAYVHAVKKLNSGRAPTLYDRLVKIHLDHAPESHGVPAFLPWHRAYLRAFERELQKIDPQVVVPFWDWTVDSQAPERSIVLSDVYFGGNGTGTGNTVASGAFAGWTVSYPRRHVLRRQYDHGDRIGAFPSSEEVGYILGNVTTYDSLRQDIEGASGPVHVGIGGDMSQMYCPNDPLYWSHAAFLDLLWAEWQTRNPRLAHTYNGHDGHGAEVTTQDMLDPFNTTVAATLDTTALGYFYPRWGQRSVTGQ
jgi:hypothetical protein